MWLRRKRGGFSRGGISRRDLEEGLDRIRQGREGRWSGLSGASRSSWRGGGEGRSSNSLLGAFSVPRSKFPTSVLISFQPHLRPALSDAPSALPVVLASSYIYPESRIPKFWRYTRRRGYVTTYPHTRGWRSLFPSSFPSQGGYEDRKPPPFPSFAIPPSWCLNSHFRPHFDSSTLSES